MLASLKTKIANMLVKEQTEAVSMFRRVTDDDLPTDGIVFVPVPADALNDRLENGMSTGAFFSILPTAYADPAAATNRALVEHGSDAKVIAIDTSLVETVTDWRVDDRTPDRLVIWGTVPARALTEHVAPAPEATPFRS
jgi:hypothetical protein